MTTAQPLEPLSLEYAQEQDRNDKLHNLRNEFIIPTRADLKRKRLGATAETAPEDDKPSTYLCGNSLGLQPKRVRQYIDSYLSTWGSLGVFGHFKELENAKTVPWVDIGDQAADAAAMIVGAWPSEVAVMQTLTANLHFLMQSFYRPDQQRWKIIIESKAFPSDHYAVYSQLAQHGLAPEDALVLIEPSHSESHYFSTQHIFDIIEEQAEDTALLLLPGIHYYSGQYFDIPTITKFAQQRGIMVGWDLAHAAGNVPLKLHDWGVDFAAWCSYKYLNSGPGSIAGLFVHERHGQVDFSGGQLVNGHHSTGAKDHEYRHRLSGWWGSDKASRFKMNNVFVPISGAAGWQLSNPSTFDCTSVIASLSVFNKTSMHALREKSVKLTAYLERLLNEWPLRDDLRCFTILTPSDPAQRGAQLSVKLSYGLLETVMEVLEHEGVVVDERRPDVVRVAPAPLYNTYEDVWRFMVAFEKALNTAVEVEGAQSESTSVLMGDSDHAKRGWSEVT